ncbi:MAG: pyrroline-5-carboxylate reductase [Chloroflexi bacterium]|nr:pyrroline-5-carboxylate reductase [Chloroflexota bacterium]
MTDRYRFELAVIGGGVMGGAFVEGLLQAAAIPAESVLIVEPVTARREELRTTLNVRVSAHPDDSLRDARFILVAVKPQQFDAVASALRPVLRPQQTVLSLMAGVPLELVSQQLGHSTVVRLMPNIMCRIGAGVIVWLASGTVSEEETQRIETLFQALGSSIRVYEDRYVDMATAVSGSGPAFAFVVLEALTDAAVHIGFARDQAAMLATQTLLGAALLAKETGVHPAILKNTVTSPGGTTAAGLLVLEQRGLRAALEEAVFAAYTKTQRLR